MMNVICIMGRIVHKPELRTTASGVSVANFTVAVDRSRADADGNRQTDFIDVVAWRGTADFVSKWFDKGSMIAVNGSLQTRSYEDKQGNKRKAFEIVADAVNFCGGKNEGAKHSDADDSGLESPAQEAPKPAQVAYDDLPF